MWIITLISICVDLLLNWKTIYELLKALGDLIHRLPKGQRKAATQKATATLKIYKDTGDKGPLIRLIEKMQHPPKGPAGQ